MFPPIGDISEGPVTEGDGKALYFSLRSLRRRSQWRTYLIPLPHGADLPRFPARGVQSDANLPNRAALQAGSNPRRPDSRHTFRLADHSGVDRVGWQ